MIYIIVKVFAIFMNIIYFFNLNLLTGHFSNYVTALIYSNWYNQR